MAVNILVGNWGANHVYDLVIALVINVSVCASMCVR